MRFVTDEESKKQYKEFLENNERCNFQQSLEWAEVKKPNWKPEVILAEDEEGNIIGSLCVWVRKMPIFGNMLYSPRGPVCDIHDIEVMKQLTDGVKELGKKYKAFVLRNEPDVLSSDETYREIVTTLGYKIKDDAKDFKDEIQPRYVFRLDIKGKTEDFLNDQVEGIGYYDGQGSLFDMQLCCVITLMKSEDDLNPYTFTLPLNPIQKGES